MKPVTNRHLQQASIGVGRGKAAQLAQKKSPNDSRQRHLKTDVILLSLYVQRLREVPQLCIFNNVGQVCGSTLGEARDVTAVYVSWGLGSSDVTRCCNVMFEAGQERWHTLQVSHDGVQEG